MYEIDVNIVCTVDDTVLSARKTTYCVRVCGPIQYILLSTPCFSNTPGQGVTLLLSSQCISSSSSYKSRPHTDKKERSDKFEFAS